MAAVRYSRALVTGASSGIGEAYARRLAGLGTDLVLVARRRDLLDARADDLRERHRVSVDVVAADLGTDDGLATVEAALGGVDLLVNNAGFGIAQRLASTDPAAVDAMVRVNALAVAHLTRAALPAMLDADHGAIVNVSSVAGFSPSPSFATYNGTKAFVTMFTEALALEVHGTGVRVQALCPGLTRTGFQSVSGETGTDGLPGFMWHDADHVVRASLAALATSKVIVTPGMHNKAFVAATSVLPRAWWRRIAGAVMSRRGR